MKLMDRALRQTKPDAIAERRGSRRFPFDEQVAYRFFQGRLIVEGTGKAINMSSGGLLFMTPDRLPEGHKLQVTVNWPVQLDGGCRLKVVATGRVLRSDGRTAAVRIEHYEFHTRGSRLLDHHSVRDAVSREFHEECAVS
jgi:hypothetical protein